MLPRRSARNSAEGLATSASPMSVISNTPISSVAPKRFFTPRRMRNWCPRSPSKYSTASTMCSSTRGPAMAPSLVTCPTRTSEKPLDFAIRISSKLHARTCDTVPGALSMLSSHMVWMLSITTSVDVRRLLQAGGDVAQIDRGGQLHVRIRQAEPARAQAHLLDRLLAGDVHHPPSGTCQASRHLQQQRGLADAGIAAHQHRGRRHQPAAEHPIKLGDAGHRPRRRRAAAGQAGERHLAPGRLPARSGTNLDHLLDDRVPFLATLATPSPLQRDGAAGLANKPDGGLGHAVSLSV